MEPGLEFSSPASRLASPPAVPKSPERLTSGGPDGGKANRQVEAGLHLEHKWGRQRPQGSVAQLTQKTQSPRSMVRLQGLEGGVTELETTKAFPPARELQPGPTDPMSPAEGSVLLCTDQSLMPGRYSEQRLKTTDQSSTHSFAHSVSQCLEVQVLSQPL